jgi:uncharacterized membrane protein YdjX (TVP38/TMEM64 family)
LYLVLAGRLSPLPSYVCNYGFSTTDVSLGQYSLATVIAGTPMILQVPEHDRDAAAVRI